MPVSLRSIRDDELEHVKTMFACERGKGALTSPNAAAATPRWAEDAAPNVNGAAPPSSSSGLDGSTAVTGKGKASGRGRGDSNLRSDVARKTPLEAFTATFDPLRRVIKAVENKPTRTRGNGSRKKSHDGEVGTEDHQHGEDAAGGEAGATKASEFSTGDESAAEEDAAKACAEGGEAGE